MDKKGLEVRYKYSVLIAYHNEPPKYLKLLLDSIKNQKYSSAETIIVDDGSDSFPENIIQEYKELNIKYIKQHNQGLAGARNTGLKNADGEYVIFADADDCFDYHVFNTYDKAIKKYKEIDIFISKYKTLSQKGIDNIVEDDNIYTDADIEKIILSDIDHDDFIENMNIGAAWGKCYRLGFLIDNELLFNQDVKKSQDRVFNAYCYRNTKSIGLIGRSTYLYRIDNENSICNKYNANIDAQLRVTENAFRDFLDKYYANDIVFDKAFCKMKAEFLIVNYKLKYLNKNKEYKCLKDGIIEIEKFIKDGGYVECLNRHNINLGTRKRNFLLLLTKNKLYLMLYLIKKYIK